MEHNGYEIKLHKPTANYSIHSIGKGALPKVLSGLFTTQAIAKKHIDMYIGSRPQTLTKE
jgi:hypothetical protein